LNSIVVEDKENAELQMLQKRREVNGFKGFSSTDNLALINNTTLFRENDKIDKLQEQIKTLIVKYKEELKKIIKRCQKHKQMIEDELKAELDKQNKLYDETIQKNKEELERLQKQLGKG
jgi:Skp family chaperone for outer membrane proteins